MRWNFDSSRHFRFPSECMASDNDDAYNLTPAFILETVAAARGFLKSRNNVITKDEEGYRRFQKEVSDFLAWPIIRVQQALAQLSAIEDGELSKKAVESLPTIRAESAAGQCEESSENLVRSFSANQRPNCWENDASGVRDVPRRDDSLDAMTTEISCMGNRSWWRWYSRVLAYDAYQFVLVIHPRSLPLSLKGTIARPLGNLRPRVRRGSFHVEGRRCVVQIPRSDSTSVHVWIRRGGRRNIRHKPENPLAACVRDPKIKE